MASSLLDLVLMLVWPLLMSAAAWVIAIRALGEADEISAVVQALTRSKAERQDAPAPAGLPRANLAQAKLVQPKLALQSRKAESAASPAAIPVREIE